jgi:uncharacterized protein
VLQELARVFVRDALKRWVAGAELLSVEAQARASGVFLRVRVREGPDTVTVEATL